MSRRRRSADPVADLLRRVWEVASERVTDYLTRPVEPAAAPAPPPPPAPEPRDLGTALLAEGDAQILRALDRYYGARGSAPEAVSMVVQYAGRRGARVLVPTAPGPAHHIVLLLPPGARDGDPHLTPLLATVGFARVIDAGTGAADPFAPPRAPRPQPDAWEWHDGADDGSAEPA
jgi:hypothetical protein